MINVNLITVKPDVLGRYEAVVYDDLETFKTIDYDNVTQLVIKHGDSSLCVGNVTDFLQVVNFLHLFADFCDKYSDACLIPSLLAWASAAPKSSLLDNSSEFFEWLATKNIKRATSFEELVDKYLDGEYKDDNTLTPPGITLTRETKPYLNLWRLYARLKEMCVIVRVGNEEWYFIK